MAQEQMNAGEAQFKVQEAVKSISNPAQLLQESIHTLDKFGGFDIVETLDDVLENLNPEKKARKKIFLTDEDQKAERESLKKSLLLWSELLSGSEDPTKMIAESQAKVKKSQEVITNNLKNAVEATKDLERSYRSVALFFANAESNKIKNISFLNAQPEQLADLDTPKFFLEVQKEIVDNYDKLDLVNNYGLLVIPGYLGNNQVVEKWSKMAYENKVMLVTDFKHGIHPDTVIKDFEKARLTGDQPHFANVIMSCNWLVGRGKFSELEEDEDLYVPPAGALAGKIYNTKMSQVTAGKKHGGLNEVDGVCFDLKKSEIANLEKLGLVPMIKEYGKVMAFSAKTLFNGNNIGLQTYSVVRVFDYVAKVLMHFLNQRTFENFNSKTRGELHSQIVGFLDGIKGADRLIENFSIDRFEQDPIDKTKIHLDISLTPYFPAKTFTIKLEGEGGERKKWADKSEQKEG